MVGTLTARSGLRLVPAGLGLALLLVALMPLAALAIVFGRVIALGAIAAVALVLLLSPAFWRLLDADRARERYRGFVLPAAEQVLPAHLWTRSEAGRMTLGVDALLARAMGPADRAELPEAGQRVEAGDLLVKLQRGRRTLDVVAPFAGVVARVNDRLTRSPELVHRSPYGEGWLVRLVATEPAPASVTSRETMRALFRNEVDRFISALTVGPAVPEAAHDGGEVIENLHDAIPEDRWDHVRQAFFTRRS